MSKAALEKLRQALRKVDRPGTFCASGSVPAILPGLEVEGLGSVGLPLTVRQAKDVSMLAAAYNRSRFGKREPDEEKAQLAEIWSPLRNALLGSIVRRIRRRGRNLNEER